MEDLKYVEQQEQEEEGDRRCRTMRKDGLVRARNSIKWSTPDVEQHGENTWATSTRVDHRTSKKCNNN